MKLYINGVTIKIEYSFVLIISLALIFDNESLIYVLLFSALHEMGHIIFLYALGSRADSVTIAYYGIGLRYSSALSLNREIIFLIGGIMVNLLFAVLDVYREINMALFCINALPVFPLDGGRIWKLLLCKWFDISLSDKLLTVTGSAVIMIIFVLAFVRGNLSLAMIAIYLIIYSFNNSF